MNETNEAAVTVNEKCLVQTLDSRMCKSEKILRLWEKQKDARNFCHFPQKHVPQKCTPAREFPRRLRLDAFHGDCRNSKQTIEIFAVDCSHIIIL